MDSLDKTDQIIINLKVLSMLQEGERLCVRNDQFSVYNAGWTQAVCRWIYGESRWADVDDIKSVVNDALRVLGTYMNMLQNSYATLPATFAFGVPPLETSIGFVRTLARELTAAVKGIGSLKRTYSGDQLITATFDLLIERMTLEIDNSIKVVDAACASPSPSPSPAAASDIVVLPRHTPAPPPWGATDDATVAIAAAAGAPPVPVPAPAHLVSTVIKTSRTSGAGSSKTSAASL